MPELHAHVDGCEVTVTFDEQTPLSDELRSALAELADAMHNHQAGAAEVEGFGLRVGSLGLGGVPIAVSSFDSCWGFSSGPSGKSCTWYSQEDGGNETTTPDSCTIYSVKGLR